jgi:hypothetical protein
MLTINLWLSTLIDSALIAPEQIFANIFSTALIVILSAWDVFGFESWFGDDIYYNTCLETPGIPYIFNRI